MSTGPLGHRPGVGHTQPSQKHVGGFDGVLRSYLHRDVVTEERGSSRAEGGVSLWDDSFGFEEPHQFVVGVIQVKLELTSGGDVESINPRGKSAIGIRKPTWSTAGMTVA